VPLLVASFEGADPGFAAGAPLDRSAERPAALVDLAGRAGSALAWDDHGATVPHRVVSFISVLGCGTRPSIGIRQNRRQVIESATSRQRLP
jgi:hypothetical protein